MEQRLTLQQKLLQKLSPQQIQVIKLLEIPTVQLEQRIKKELEENPVLEIESDTPDTGDEVVSLEADQEKDVDNDEFTFDDYYAEDEDIPSYKLNAKNYSKDDKYIDIPFSVGTTFHEFLYEQLGLISLTEEEKQLSEYIIGNIDDDGYLRRDLASISDDLAFNMNLDVPEEKLLKILKEIQQFDPPGVGARNLQECLLIQLKRKNSDDLKLSIEIVENYFPEFTKKHYTKIQSKLELTEEQLKAAIDPILKLNPKP
jgi:RNA polymerase sigma-54 factor